MAGGNSPVMTNQPSSKAPKGSEELFATSYKHLVRARIHHETTEVKTVSLSSWRSTPVKVQLPDSQLIVVARAEGDLVALKNTSSDSEEDLTKVNVGS